jgi:hypothetical protein
MFALVSADASSVWTQLEVLMTRWRKIDEAAGLPGPFIYRVTRTGDFSPLKL